MEPSARYCFCSPGGPPWGARLADRYCGLCGRELLAVIPRAPLLTAGPPATVAAYLHPGGAGWVGTVCVELLGLVHAPATLRWLPQGPPAIRVAGRRRLSHTLRELSLQAPFPERSAPGRVGCARRMRRTWPRWCRRLPGPSAAVWWRSMGRAGSGEGIARDQGHAAR